MRSLVLVLSVLSATLLAQEPTFRADNRTVAVFATVTGADGRLVTGLPRDAFSIYDNDRRQDITLFANDVQPITVVMLLDRSGSMRANFEIVERAAEAFVSAMLPADRARIGSFADRIQIDPRDFTSDRGALLAILRTELQVEGPTPLWNAVSVGLTALRRLEGRRVILVFTDGADRPLSNMRVTLRDVTRRAEEEDVMVYAIGLASGGFGGGGGRGGRGRGGRGIIGRGQGGGAQDGPDPGLAQIAAATGGGYFELTSTNDLAATFARVADELHQQYALAFTPTTLDGRMHALEVRLAGNGLVARARKNYLARAR